MAVLMGILLGSRYVLALPGYYWLGADGRWYGIFVWVDDGSLA